MKKIKRFLIAAALIAFGSLSCFGLDWYNPVEDVRMETSNDWEDWTVYIDGIKDDWFYHVDKTLSTSMRSETVEVDFITFDKIFNEWTDEDYYEDTENNSQTKKLCLDLLDLATRVLKYKTPYVGLTFNNGYQVTYYVVYRAPNGTIAAVLATQD